jgi:hypothetical protein
MPSSGDDRQLIEDRPDFLIFAVRRLDTNGEHKTQRTCMTNKH